MAEQLQATAITLPVLIGIAVDLEFATAHMIKDKNDFLAVCIQVERDFTTRSIGRSFAIALDGRAISLLRIMEPILRGVGEIDGGFTAAEAKQLAARIESGACRSQQ